MRAIYGAIIQRLNRREAGRRQLIGHFSMAAGNFSPRLRTEFFQPVTLRLSACSARRSRDPLLLHSSWRQKFFPRPSSLTFHCGRFTRRFITSARDAKIHA